jgi:hypothetical protein
MVIGAVPRITDGFAIALISTVIEQLPETGEFPPMVFDQVTPDASETHMPTAGPWQLPDAWRAW